MAIGEAGTITTNSPGENDPISVSFAEGLDNPVIVLTSTSIGGDPFTLRVISTEVEDGVTTGFTFIIEEWEYLDGPHPAVETINWLAIEEGVHELPDGRVIEAGTTTADNTNTAVTLDGDFDAPPVVLTSVMSENDTTTVDSDPLNITADGFNVRLQEEEGQDGVHAPETVGYIAIQAGGDADNGTANTFTNLDNVTETFTLGDTFDDVIVLAETQTINGGNPGTVVIESQSNSDVDLTFEEEQSADAETFHLEETVGVVAFENGLIPCLTPGTLVLTPGGEVPIECLNPGDLVSLIDGSSAPLGLRLQRKLSKAYLSPSPSSRPIRITAGSLGSGLPKRDLLVSPQHRMLLKSAIAQRMFGTAEVLVAANRLLKLKGISQVECDTVEYIHLVFDRHVVLFAEGAPTESFLPGPEVFRTMPNRSLLALRARFPAFLSEDNCIEPARLIPHPRQQKKLLYRHLKNAKPVLGQRFAACGFEDQCA